MKTEEQLRDEYCKVIQENMPFGFEYYEELFQWIINERKSYAREALIREWINIKDKQPNQGQWCLIYSWRGILMASYWGNQWAIFQYSGPGVRINIDDVTHWMPLPESPYSITNIELP